MQDYTDIIAMQDERVALLEDQVDAQAAEIRSLREEISTLVEHIMDSLEGLERRTREAMDTAQVAQRQRANRVGGTDFDVAGKMAAMMAAQARARGLESDGE